MVRRTIWPGKLMTRGGAADLLDAAGDLLLLGAQPARA